MAQYDVCRNGAAAYPPYLLVVQHDILREMPTTVVVPLVPEGELPVWHRQLYPRFEVEGREMVMLALQIAGVANGVLGPVVVSLAERRYDITPALDLLFTGI